MSSSSRTSSTLARQCRSSSRLSGKITQPYTYLWRLQGNFYLMVFGLVHSFLCSILESTSPSGSTSRACCGSGPRWATATSQTTSDSRSPTREEPFISDVHAYLGRVDPKRRYSNLGAILTQVGPWGIWNFWYIIKPWNSDKWEGSRISNKITDARTSFMDDTRQVRGGVRARLQRVLPGPHAPLPHQRERHPEVQIMMESGHFGQEDIVYFCYCLYYTIVTCF